MVKIELFQSLLFGNEIKQIPLEIISIRAIPSPEIHQTYSTEYLFYKGYNIVTYIIYKPKIYPEDEPSKTLIGFYKKATDMQSQSERLIGIVRDFDNPPFIIHPSATNLPVLNPNQLNIELPKIPSTRHEYLMLFGELYRVIRTDYSTFRNEINLAILKVDKDDSIFDELTTYGIQPMLEL